MRRQTTIRLVLAGLAALGIGVPAAGGVAALRRGRDDRAAAADRELSALRQRLRPGERIGLVVAPADRVREDEEIARAKYALAPAFVEPLRVRDCAAGAGESCRLHLVEHVLLPLPRTEATAALERRLALVPVETLDGALLLRRGAP
jgi:hypothetical protein